MSRIADAGYDSVYGARPLKRAIQSMVEDMLSMKMLDGSIQNGDEILIFSSENGIDAEKVIDKAEVL